MEKMTLTFVPAKNSVYIGFDGPTMLALVVPYDPEGICGPTNWQWTPYSGRSPHERQSWAFPNKNGRSQRERSAQDAIRRAAQYIGHGFARPLDLCSDDCPDCPAIVMVDGDPATGGS